MKRVLELPVMVYADDLKGGVTRSIREFKFNARAVQQLFLKNFQIDHLKRQLCLELVI